MPKKKHSVTIPNELDFVVSIGTLVGLITLVLYLYRRCPSTLFPLLTPIFPLISRQTQFVKYQVETLVTYRWKSQAKKEFLPFDDVLNFFQQEDPPGLGRQDMYFCGKRKHGLRYFRLSAEERERYNHVAVLKARRILEYGFLYTVPSWAFGLLSSSGVAKLVFYYMAHASYAFFNHGSEEDLFKNRENRFLAGGLEVLFSGLLFYQPIVNAVSTTLL